MSTMTAATEVNYLDSDLLHDVELLQRQGMLWVVDGSDQMYVKLRRRILICSSASVPAGTGASFDEAPLP